MKILIKMGKKLIPLAQQTPVSWVTIQFKGVVKILQCDKFKLNLLCFRLFSSSMQGLEMDSAFVPR